MVRTDSQYASAVNQAAADVAKARYVASVVNPLTSQGASALSKNQATGYLSVTFSASPGALSESDAQTIINAAAKPAHQLGGRIDHQERAEHGRGHRQCAERG